MVDVYTVSLVLGFTTKPYPGQVECLQAINDPKLTAKNLGLLKGQSPPFTAKYVGIEWGDERHGIALASKSLGKYGAPEGIRTPDLCLRRAALYPAELRARRPHQV
jgi:hypothetical protein